jgi:hypothetical protein
MDYSARTNEATRRLAEIAPAIAEEFTKASGKPWHVRPRNDNPESAYSESPHWIQICDGEGRALSLNVNSWDGYVRARPDFPDRDHNGKYVRPDWVIGGHGYETPEARAALKRDGAAIGREFARKLLADLVSGHDKMTAYLADAARFATEQRQVAERLAASVGAGVARHQYDPERTPEFRKCFGPGGDFSADVKVHTPTRVEMDLRVDPATAEKILAILATL